MEERAPGETGKVMGVDVSPGQHHAGALFGEVDGHPGGVLGAADHQDVEVPDLVRCRTQMHAIGHGARHRQPGRGGRRLIVDDGDRGGDQGLVPDLDVDPVRLLAGGAGGSGKDADPRVGGQGGVVHAGDLADERDRAHTGVTGLQGQGDSRS